MTSATDPTVSSTHPTAPSTPVPPVRRLERSGTDRMLGGVCGGLAAYSGIDPVLWRVGAVLLALTGPGVFVYLLLWVLVPLGAVPAGWTPNLAEQFVGRVRSALGGTGTARPRG